ncbi:MAG: long-chain fatty acid--CoA ligase [Desulfuromonadales bacterium]|nr:long-chain fatty acid--CoA ligase [Desulfuromonadales bacterium]
MNRTLPQMVVDLAARREQEVALRRKADGAYRPILWRELAASIALFGRGLLQLGMRRGDRVALMAPGGPEWVYADLGAMAGGAVTVPIYHTEQLNAVRQILKDSGSRFLFISNPSLAARLLQQAEAIPQLEHLILLSGTLEHPLAVSLEQFLTAAESVPQGDFAQALAAGTAADIATLIYTSGTTGIPKGVQLTHRNILANVEDCRRLFDLGPGDECLSFLPLSHVFERVDGYYFMLLQGVVIAYAESLETVPANLAEVRPTVMVSVPRLYEKIYARVLERVQSSPWLRRRLFFAALRAGRRRARLELAGDRPGRLLRLAALFSDRLVFAKMRRRLGGRLRYCISGGAPLNPEIAEFFLAAGIPIFEGYGLTESAGGIAVNTPAAHRLGTVGRPFPGTEVHLAADGEILLRGPAIFSGYWNRPDESEEALSADGWFHTGDIGCFDQDGFLAITDRKKDLIVTASGENIAPQLLENLFKTDPLIANAIVYGDRRPYLSALLIPDFEPLESFAQENGIEFADHCELVNHPRVLQVVRERIDTLQENLTSFQRVKRFTLLSADFSRQQVTPTLKVRRNLVQEHYKEVLEGMYRAKDHGTHDSGFCIVENLSEQERD